ncbi:nucleoside/nucleotide kinase family protein [Plantactinospora endophytica]|nr:uridylate kinase [Plantactinospora endophytica]
MASGTRGELLDRLAGAIGSATAAYPLRVAVDGPPAAGKTMLADELAVVLRARGREVIRASIDNFMLPRVVRYRRGRSSPDACYRDSFDYGALRRVLLDPLGPGGDRRYRPAVYDWHADTALSEPPATASVHAVLLVDGVFLQRPELVDLWDLRIFVSASSERLVERARIRDLARLDSVAEVERRFRLRYLPAQELYFAESRPAERADIVVHNDEVQRPGWEFRLYGRASCSS